ncbi:MAG TPA: hypothetical protein VGH90_05240, partial [Chthoniobacteraceae bacterium]|jgi:hypothetical protein
MASKPSTQYACPFCKANIPLADVNVSTDVALCRACGKTSSFSAVAGVSDLAAVDLNSPPRKVRVDVTPDGRTRVVIKERSFVAILFFAVFILFWSGLSMGGIYGTQIYHRSFDLKQSLFGLPFLAGTVVLVSIFAFLAFGHWEITTGPGTGTVFVGVGPIGRRRRFRYSRSSLVTVDSATSSKNQQRAIAIATDGEIFKFGSGISEDALRYLAASLQQAVARS